MHAAACAVSEHEPAARVLRRPQVDARRSVRRLDVEHRRGVCRPMSSTAAARLTRVTETKGNSDDEHELPRTLAGPPGSLPRRPDDRPRRDDRRRRAAVDPEDLGFSDESLAWVVNAYLITFGGFLLLGGRFGDLFGHRRLFLPGSRSSRSRPRRAASRRRRRCSSALARCRGSAAPSSPPSRSR